MTPNDDGERHARLMALFEEAIAVPFSHRKAFVEQLSGSDTDLREELASLLDAHDSSADYFEDLSEQLVSPAYASVMRRARRAREAALLPHLQAEIGEKYRVLQGLGGGMSRVFLAEELKLARRVVSRCFHRRWRERRQLSGSSVRSRWPRASSIPTSFRC